MWSDPRTYLAILALLTVVVQFVWLLSRLNSTSRHQQELIELLRGELREQGKYMRGEFLFFRQELSQMNQNILDIARDKT